VRFDSAIAVAAEQAEEATRGGRRELEEVSKVVRSQAQAMGKRLIAEMDSLVQDVLGRASRLDVTPLNDEEFVAARTNLEQELLDAGTRWRSALGSVTEQLTAIAFPNGETAVQINHYDEMEALDTDLEALRERAEEDLELVQLGTAIQVINHEFEGTVNAIRRSLRRIKGWADANPALREPYRDLRASFEHLDGYLRLFTPFHRRLYRTPVEIAGAEIETFLRDVFEQKLMANDVKLVATPAFAAHRVVHFPSVIYPVFVNLLDNALYWLADYRGDRTVTLDASDGRMLVRDTGPGVPTRDRDAIFEFGFSRKPGGTGYGLSISREVLQREGWTLEINPSRSDVGAEFVIAGTPKKQKKGSA
jgi:signal transduction histidine kinase